MTEINQDKRYKYIFDEILTLTDDGFVVVDNHDVITDINEQYCQYLKTTREYAIGRSIAEIIPNTKMIDIVNYAYQEEGAILRLSEKSDDDSDRIFLVNRSAVYDENHNVIAGVAQVKFRLQTLDSAKKLMRKYSEYEFYREEYRSRNSSQYSFDKIVGNSPRFAEVKKAGYKAAKTMFPVLLTGETGTGKEVFANAIHNNGEQREKPMVSINCAAIPNELLESELFGYEKGAFTGASEKGKEGKFELADGGTIFLDEIGELPLEMQAKLLRAIQDGEFYRVGGTSPVKTNVRIISATNRDLERYVEEGRFRRDLYYRLNVVPIKIPALSERTEDIPALIYHFLSKYGEKFGLKRGIAESAVEYLQQQQWPGNIRELENTVQRLMISAKGEDITLMDVMQETHPELFGAGTSDNQFGNTGTEIDLQNAVEDYEKGLIKYACEKYGSTRKAASAIGISQTQLVRKKKKYQL